MKEHYFTCFDSYFLPQGLALLKSLQTHSDGFILWIICLDRQSFNVLSDYAFPEVRLLLSEDWEDGRLLSAKHSRSRTEYIWTLSPYLPKWVFQSDLSLKRITYLDADMFFLSDPSPIFEEFELSGKDILITEHAFDKEYDQSTLLGRFCVQFIIYKRDGCEQVRQWWEDRCIEWCFARWEDGKFGDQKYLDQWPILFPERIHVLSRTDYILAPWNSRKFPSPSLILWHFHGFRLLKGSRILLHSNYRISDDVHNIIYLPYAKAVVEQICDQTYYPERYISYSKVTNYLYFYMSCIFKFFVRRQIPSLNPNIKIISFSDVK